MPNSILGVSKDNTKRYLKKLKAYNDLIGIEKVWYHFGFRMKDDPLPRGRQNKHAGSDRKLKRRIVQASRRKNRSR